METRPRLVTVRETGPERSGLVGPHDAHIPEREVLQVLLRFTEVQVQQEFERKDVV